MRNTVFLTTAGQHVTIGSSDTAELTEATLAAPTERGLRGWLCVMAGRYYGRQAPVHEAGRPVNGGLPGEWDGAVAAFHATRLA
ncbi:MAG: hypothetical protein ACRYG8_46250 [Janthinobacterium lividum]